MSETVKETLEEITVTNDIEDLPLAFCLENGMRIDSHIWSGHAVVLIGEGKVAFVKDAP